MRRHLLYLFMVLLAAAGCDDFLDQEPQSEISKDEALGDFLSVSFALTGAYSGFTIDNSYYEEFMMYYGDLAGGNAMVSPALNPERNPSLRNIYNFNTSEVDDLDQYSEIYKALNAVNNVINAVPDLVDGTEEEKNRTLGEALALRALIHFDLLRLFAQPYNYTADASHIGVVVLTETPDPDDRLPRSTVREGYEQVVRDLENAISLLPIGGSNIRMTRNGARALLARVFLYMEDWSRAAALANEVITDPQTALATREEYLNLWDNDYLDNEYIFRLENNAPQNTLSFLWGNVESNSVPSLVVADDLYSIYDSADIRLQLFTPLTVEGVGVIVTQKYPFQEQVANSVPVIRLSEVFLIRAEAYAELNREDLARTDLNTIMQRADPSVPDVIVGGQELKDLIFLERRKELALEGHLLFDLNRTQRSVMRQDCNSSTSNCNLNYPNDRFILPIPLGALLANDNLRQNEGY